MWKKLFAVVAVLGLLFCAAPAIAQANGWYWTPNVHMYQHNAAGSGIFTAPNHVLMVTGTIGSQSMSLYSGCAFQAQGYGASQTLTGNGFTLTQRAYGYQVQKAHSYSFGGYINGPR